MTVRGRTSSCSCLADHGRRPGCHEEFCNTLKPCTEPPYNGFAGVSPAEEGGLVEPYKVGLADKWDITKNKLDDLYIRFFRIAERRVAEQTGKGIICFVSNSSWLGDPSAVVMRERLLSEFDTITIDHLNGDSRETGKKTPDGKPDPSIFSTPLNPSGITRGVAISMLVRTADHGGSAKKVEYRDFWGQNKREQLEPRRRAPVRKPLSCGSELVPPPAVEPAAGLCKLASHPGVVRRRADARPEREPKVRAD